MHVVKNPSKHSLLQFVYYNLGGVSFFVIGYALFSLLYGLFGVWWLLAKAIADVIGWMVNFIIQRYLAFREEAVQHDNRTIVKKFSLFSLMNLGIDYAIVGGLKWVGVSPFIGLFVAAGFFTVWKYIWYKHWIFKHS